MNHYVYLIKDIITDKKYIGVRSCECDPFEDNYMGSSSVLKRTDYPNLKKDILSVFPDRTTALAVETLLVNEHFVNRDDTFNRRTGGERPVRTKQLASRQMEGIARAKANGTYKGRIKSIDEDRVIQLTNEGLGATAISRKLGCSRSSVYKIRNRNSISEKGSL